MNNRSYRLGLMLIVCVILIISILAISRTLTEKLELQIELDQRVYHSGSALPVLIRLRNSGNTTVVVNGRMSVNFLEAPKASRDVSFIIMGPDEEIVPFIATVHPASPTAEDIIVLRPGEFIEKGLDLAIRYDLQRVGSYSMYAIYQHSIKSDNNLLTWKGELTSNTITFDVVP